MFRFAVGAALAAALVLVPSVAARPAASSIPGLYAVDVYGNLRDRGFTCTRPQVLRTQVAWTCRLNTGAAEYIVDVMGRSPGELTQINADVLVYQGDPTAMARPLLGFVATLPYEGSQPARARRFVESHVGGTGVIRIGGARLRVYGTQARARLLQITPA